MARNFWEMIRAKWAMGKFVCVGLDSELDKIPSITRRHYVGGRGGSLCVSVIETMTIFNRAIVETTHDLVCAYKPNSAFYEAHGVEGLTALQRTILDIHRIAPDVPVILDAKRAGIDNTNNGYVKMAFDYLGADAITVNPYLGTEALQPFLDRTDKGIFILCRTSNKGASEIQGLMVPSLQGQVPLYQHVARLAAGPWDTNHNVGLVVGATAPEELRVVRDVVGDGMPILIPGIGAQGGNVEQTVCAGQNSRGEGMIINSSRGIIFASSGVDFAEAARAKVLELHREINLYVRKEVTK